MLIGLNIVNANSKYNQPNITFLATFTVENQSDYGDFYLAILFEPLCIAVYHPPMCIITSTNTGMLAMCGSVM